MKDTVNYLNHRLVQPEIVNGRFDQISPQVNPQTFKERALHVTQIALPFFCLYQPLSHPISLITGGGRLVTHVCLAFTAIKEKKSLEFGKQSFQVAIAVFLFAATFFEFKVGLFVSNGYDTAMGIAHIAQYVHECKFAEASKESLQVLGSVLYLTFMLTGTLEYLMLMFVVQGLVALYQSREEFAEGRYPESLLCFAMAMLRFSQADQTHEQIQARNLLLSFQKCQELFNRASKGRAPRELINSELNDIDRHIEQRRVVMKDATGKEYDFGTYFNEYGKELVKGGNLELRKVTTDGQTFYELDFKVNRVFRKQIENVIEDYKSMQEGQVSAVLKAANSHATDVVITKGEFKAGTLKMGSSHEIAIKSLGHITIGSSPELPGLQQRVIVKIDSTKNLFDLHEMLSLMNMERAIQTSTQLDIERMKLGHLYRVFFPRQATSFERTEEFFSMPVDQLKEKMIADTPDMQGIMENYFSKMEKAEILPGKVRYQIKGLADQLRKEGGEFLTAAITGTYDEDTLFKRVQTILQMGMLSNETRTSHGFISTGLSPRTDFKTGGADSIFTQFISKGHEKKNITVNDLHYQSDVRLLISLDALETGTYQYNDDQFGNRSENSCWEGTYFNRPGMLEFARSQNIDPTKGNEVMLKERLDRKYIFGISVRNDRMKTGLTDHLRQANLIQTVNGVEMVNGTSVDQFIRSENKPDEPFLNFDWDAFWVTVNDPGFDWLTFDWKNFGVFF